MTLAILLIVLLIDRLLWQGGQYRQHRWFDQYSQKLLASATGQWLAGRRLGALGMLLPLLLAVALLQWLSGDALGFILGILVLLFALGPGDLAQDVDGFLQARNRGDDEHAARHGEDIAGPGLEDTEPERSLAVASATLVAGNHRLFAPLCWFILLGPLGAALYRLADLVNSRTATGNDMPASLGASATRLMHLLDWLPARLTAAAFAVAGNFDAVVQAWRARPASEEDIPASDDLLIATGRAALASWPDEEEIAAGELPPVVEDTLALIWRTLIIWLLAVGALTLIAGLT